VLVQKQFIRIHVILAALWQADKIEKFLLQQIREFGYRIYSHNKYYRIASVLLGRTLSGFLNVMIVVIPPYFFAINIT